MSLLSLLLVQATIIVSVVVFYSLYLHRKAFRLYRWWVGGLWVKHVNTQWFQCLWLIEPELGYVVDETSASYHLGLKTIVGFENYTKEGYTL